MKYIIAILGGVAFIALFALYNGFVLSILFGWFLVPLGLPQIGIAHAYGLSLLASVILSTRGLSFSGDKKAIFATGLLMPAMALFLGWIAVGFM